MTFEFDVNGEKYTIRPDTYSWILERHGVRARGDNVGAPAVTIVGYYGTLKQAIDKLGDDAVKGSLAEQVLGELWDLQNTTQQILDELKRLGPLSKPAAKVKAVVED